MPTREELIAEAQRRGLMQSSQPTRDDLLAEAKRRGLDVPEKSMWQKAKDAWTGQTEYPEAGNAQDWVNSLPLHKQLFSGMGWRTATADVLGNDEDVENAIIKSDPALKDSFFNDKFGNRLFKGRDGTVYHVNTPGASISDTISGIGNIGSYAVGGMLTGGVKNLAARTATTGGVEAGINAINQKLSGRDEIDKGEALLSGLIGGGFELAKPIVSKVWRAVKNSKAGNKQAGKMLADELGAENLTNEQIEQLGYYVNNLDDKVTKESMLSHVELNQRPTRGSLLYNQQILENEKALASRGSQKAKTMLENIDTNNQKALSEAFNPMMKNPDVDYISSATKIGKGVKNVADEMSDAASQAWDNIPNAQVKKESLLSIPQNIKSKFENSSFYIDKDVTPTAKKAFTKLSKFAKTLTDDIAKGDELIDWNRINLERKRIGSLYSSLKTAEDRAAYNMVKKEFEDTYKKAFENSLFSGNKMAAEKMTDAVNASHEYFKLFNPKNRQDAAGKAVQSWINDGVDPEKIAGVIFTKKGVLKENAVPMVRKLKDVLGADSDAFKDVKDLAIKRLFTDRTKESLRTSLKNSLQDTPTFMNEIFTKQELKFMSRTLHHLDNILPKKGSIAARSSGTAERMFDWLTRPINPNSPLTGVQTTIKGIMNTLTGAERNVLSLPMKQIPNNSILYNTARGAVINEGNN